MKKFLILLFGFFALNTANAQDWISQPAGTLHSGLLRSVYFTDANTGYAVGGGGQIVKS